MKTLVLIENNLKHDNRVKRHIRTMLELGRRVTVLAVPHPDDRPGLEAPGLRMLFWRCPEITLRPPHLHRLAERLNVTGFVFQAFPGAFASIDTARPMVPLSRLIQGKLMECGWWDDWQHPLCKQDVDPDADHRQVVGYFEFMLQWAAAACEHPADLVYCNDLPSLLAGVAHKRRYHSRLVFDAHEIYYDMMPGMQTRLWKTSMALLERALRREADAVIGVSGSHVDWMRRHYHLGARAVCVPNVFGMGQEVAAPAPREPGTPLRIYYHGASDRFRGLTQVTRALALVPGTQLTLRCFPSETLDEVQGLARELGVAERVHVLPLVPSEVMIDTIRAEADVGIHACEPPTAVNIRVGLANKFVEYLMAGVPIITSPLEEQARIVTEHELGYVLPDNSPEAVARALRWMQERRAELPAMGQRAHEAGARRFSWKNIRRTLEQALSEQPGHAAVRADQP